MRRVFTLPLVACAALLVGTAAVLWAIAGLINNIGDS